MQERSQKTEKYSDRPHVLVVDDDRRIRDLLSRYLTENGFVVLSAENAREAENILQHFEVDVVVLDVMMPEKTGLEWTRELREKSRIPVVLLTALGEVENRIQGLEVGADDYLPKPFEPRELLLRLNAILKRTTTKKKEARRLFEIGRWVFDENEESLRSGEEFLKLTTVEAALIKALAQSAGEVVSREELAKRCSMDSNERTIDVQVTRLRRKIGDDPKNPRVLQTIRGKGYLLRGEELSGL